MNDIHQQIDRLVDGELSDDDQRELLQAVDNDPARWRDVALAFLEAQVWSRELKNIGSTSDVQPRNVPLAERSSGSIYGWAMSLLLAAAAGALLAIGWDHLTSNSRSLPTDPAIASDEAEGRNSMAIPDDGPLLEAIAQPPQPVGDATFFVSTGGDRQQMQAPVFSASDFGNSWQTTATSLPADIEEALNESGRPWTRDRELIPIQLDDGRHVIVPINRIQFEDSVVYQ